MNVNHYIVGLIGLVIGALGVNTYLVLQEEPAPQLAAANNILWKYSGGYLQPVIASWSLKVPDLTSCDTIDTDANGVLSCGTDDGGGLATSTAVVDTYVIYGTSASTIGAEAAFTYDDATNVLTVGQASTTLLTFTTAWGSLVGNADTATALAANGGNCSAGNAPLGVDASGAVESCFDVWTEAENTAAAYLSTVDISANTNLAAGANLTLTDDTIDLDTALASMTSFSHTSGGNMTVSNNDTNGHVAFSSGQTLNSSAGTDKFFSISGTINNSGTAATDFLQLNMTTTAAGSGAQYALNVINDSSSVASIDVDGNILTGNYIGLAGATASSRPYNGDLMWRYSSGLVFDTGTNRNLFFNVDNTTRMFIEKSTGNIGMSESSPEARLEVSADGGAQDLMMLSSNDNNDGDRFIVKNSGLVGVGTTSPAATFAVNGSAYLNGTSTLAKLNLLSGANLFGVYGESWSDFCVSITGDAGLCDGTDNTAAGGSGLSTSTAIADTFVIYGTSASTVGSEAAFNYDDALDKLTVINASTTLLTFTTGWGSLIGNADTATALAANGGNCSAGNAPLGVDASGAVESCFDVWTEAENTAAGYLDSADIGVSVQAYDADLTTYAGITPSANIQTLLGAANYAAMRTQLDLEAGTDFYSIAAADTAFESELDNSAGLAAALSDETGTGVAVFSTSPALTTPNLGTPSAVTLTNGTGLPLTSGVTGVLPQANGGTGTTTQIVWSRTIASTSPAFISGGLMPLPLRGDGGTMVRIMCKVDGGTSKVIAIEDASANSSEDITCAATPTYDDGSITNATYTAYEEMYIDFGATTGAVNYVSITVLK